MTLRQQIADAVREHGPDEQRLVDAIMEAPEVKAGRIALEESRMLDRMVGVDAAGGRVIEVQTLKDAEPRTLRGELS